jgi:hypothetical protein
MSMDDSRYLLIFLSKQERQNLSLCSSKEHDPKISKIAIVKYEKYSPVKLSNFEYFSITGHFRFKSGAFFRT